MRKQSEILSEINEISTQENFLDVLFILCHKNLNCYSDELATRDLKKVLNENEITFLFGLWLKNLNIRKSNSISKEDSAKILHTLMDEFHISFLPSFNPNADLSYYKNTVNNPEIIKETIFYAGTGAYDYQYCNFLISKYQYDKNWLYQKKKIKLNDAINLFNYIKTIIGYKLNLKKFNDLSELYSFDINNYVFKRHPSFLTILDLLSFKRTDCLNQDFNNVGDLNEFKFKPILKTENKYFIPLPYLVSEAIYESPFYWMLEDTEYKNIALKNRGEAAEQIVKEILIKKIDKDCVFKGVNIKISKEKTLSDIDICVKHKSKMLVFQVKSKRLTQLSKKGNLEQFQIDFKQSVTDAYQQTVIAENAIRAKKYLLIEKETNKSIDYKDIDEVFSICVILDNYASITTHTRMFFYEANHEMPITISIFDLEVIINYVSDFDMLFDYFKKRTIHSKYFVADNELCYFSNYLKIGLNKNPSYDISALDPDFAQYFDSDFYLPLMKRYQSNVEILIKDIGRNDYCFCGSGKKFKNCCNNG
ncbi:MAG: SEC-C domain-containing protein [Mariniphaga sp.]